MERLSIFVSVYPIKTNNKIKIVESRPRVNV